MQYRKDSQVMSARQYHPFMSELLRCAGAILIGGRSSRMGSPKHELKLGDGRTMLDAIVGALSGVCGRIVLVGTEIPPLARDLVSVADHRTAVGPLGGIEALLTSGIDSQYLFCPCDLPLITAGLLQKLMTNTDLPATVFQVEGRQTIEPLPARISAAALPTVRRLLDAGERSVWRLMQELRLQTVLIAPAEAAHLHNVNTRADFQDAVRLLDSG